MLSCAPAVAAKPAMSAAGIKDHSAHGDAPRRRDRINPMRRTYRFQAQPAEGGLR